MAPDLGWLHRYVPAADHALKGTPGTPNLTLLLLHGTGGDENSLVGLGRLVAPEANLLSVRGRSLEEGSPRFFRRFSATRYDQAQLASEARALGEFAGAAAATYGFAQHALVALGYSNGANIAVATLAYSPASLAAAVLLRAVMPLEAPPASDMSGKRVMILGGQEDPYRPHAEGLGAYLSEQGAAVDEVVVPAGHELVEEDVARVRGWLADIGPALLVNA